jgi:hypothetical protein
MVIPVFGRPCGELSLGVMTSYVKRLFTVPQCYEDIGVAMIESLPLQCKKIDTELVSFLTPY